MWVALEGTMNGWWLQLSHPIPWWLEADHQVITETIAATVRQAWTQTMAAATVVTAVLPAFRCTHLVQPVGQASAVHLPIISRVITMALLTRVCLIV